MTHNLRFHTRDGATIEIDQGSRLTSNTPIPQPTATTFEDSMLKGDEFAENGVTFVGASFAFRLTAEKSVVIEGRVLRPAQEVGFYLWRSGERSEYSVSTVPDSDGKFRLVIRLPAASRGMRWYRITIRDQAGSRPDTATLPALVG
jgi:hypothetical protein